MAHNTAARRLQEDRQYQPSPSSFTSISPATSPAVSIDHSTPGDRTPTVLGGMSVRAFDKSPAQDEPESQDEDPTVWTAGSSSRIARIGSESTDYAGYRVRCLEANLADPEASASRGQQENMRLAMDMYKRGEGLPKWDGLVFFQDGRVVGGEDVDREREYWFEVGFVTVLWG